MGTNIEGETLCPTELTRYSRVVGRGEGAFRKETHCISGWTRSGSQTDTTTWWSMDNSKIKANQLNNESLAATQRLWCCECFRSSCIAYNSALKHREITIPVQKSQLWDEVRRCSVRRSAERAHQRRSHLHALVNLFGTVVTWSGVIHTSCIRSQGHRMQMVCVGSCFRPFCVGVKEPRFTHTSCITRCSNFHFFCFQNL